MKSETCYSKKTKEPLTEYYTEEDAQDGADYANSAFDNNLAPYKCGKCDNYHLSPKNRQTPSERCISCTDRYGKSKELYFTQKDAERRANIIYQERGLSLNTYQCEYSQGWHLTKGR